MQGKLMHLSPIAHIRGKRPDMTKPRCPWCGTDPDYIAYHDHEWGRPERDPRKLWESLMLEGFQAGLSWITILRRRDAFRTAFAGFDPEIIATWGEADITRLLANPAIIRHRGKIAATITGAGAFLKIEEMQGFTDFIWSFANQTRQPAPASSQDLPARTEASTKLSKALKSHGFKFCGPTITYAFMQANGLVNDHVQGCYLSP